MHLWQIFEGESAKKKTKQHKALHVRTLRMGKVGQNIGKTSNYVATKNSADINKKKLTPASTTAGAVKEISAPGIGAASAKLS